MWRPDKGTWRTVRHVAVLTVVFLIVNTQVAYAAGSGSGGDLLSPLNVTTSEGVPINGYELHADGGSLVDFSSQFASMALSGLFSLIQVLVGLGCWAVEFAFRFPLISMLAEPAQQIADVYNDIVVDTLGLKGLMLAWAFVFGLILFVRGKVGKGLGEIGLTLVIAAFAASMFVRPDYLLAENGPLAQSQQAAAEVAHTAVGNYNWGGHITAEELDECSTSTGAAEQTCEQRRGDEKIMPSEVARPLQDATTNALVVKPYMLLQYGRILDPSKPADRKAYALHLKWVVGGYDKDQVPEGDDPCSLIYGPAKKYCQEGNVGDGSPKLPELTPGGELLDTVSPVISDEDGQFQVFLKDLEKAGPVGKAAAAYAKEADWWRVCSALLLLFAVLMITAILLSSAMTLLGAEGADIGAATMGGITFVWGMLPGPNRQVIWKWLALFAVSVAAMFAVCMFLPLFGMAIDTALTKGPDLVAERILLLDVLAFLGLVFHRWIMARISQMGRSMAVRMRFAKVGGTHLPGDTSEIGAALALNGVGAGGGFGYGGGLRGRAFGGGGFGALGTRHRLMGHLGAMTDGAGMPFDPQRMLGAGMSEAGRGLAPLGLASVGARLGLRGAWGLAVGKHPGAEALERWRKPTADGDPGSVAGGYDGLRRGPQDRYRGADGKINDADGHPLHTQGSDRTLLSTRAHNRLVRLRGYRILHRGGRVAYGSTVGLAANTRRGRGHAQDLRSDARQQWNVWRNTVQQDGRAWSDATVGATGRHLAEHGTDHGGDGPFTSRRLSITSSHSATAVRAASEPPPDVGPPDDTPRSAWPPMGSRRISAPRTSPSRPFSSSGGAVLPGGRTPQTSSREEAAARFERLRRRVEPDADRIRRQRTRRDDDGDTS
ncbi:hypothetical protein G6045_28270 [Streptomyces sp. YC504]|uniref:Uncharacterized protein n=1 Tax=Streptomyces mesophilus TaxID=1775132 RepID=A0A6G4XPK5_9ACTN|nr:hypothetical protein [Streptomyces mesophilus]NGO79519.1 hypothetical protein [Streptomyces mesophilus]